MARRSATAEKSGYQAAQGDQQTESQPEHRTQHNNGQQANSWTPENETNHQAHMRQEAQFKESLGYLQKYNGGRADNDATIDYLANTYRNSDTPPDAKARFETLHAKDHLDRREAHEYRHLLWDAHDQSQAQYQRMNIDPTQTEQMQLQMLGPIRDAVNHKKNGQHEPAAQHDPATQHDPAAQHDPTAPQIGTYTPEEVQASNDFWSQRYQRKQQEKLEQQANHQSTGQDQTQPQDSGLAAFQNRWNNNREAVDAATRIREADAAEAREAALTHHPAQSTPTYDASQFLSALPQSEQDRLSGILSQPLNYAVLDTKLSNNISQYVQELNDGRATEESTTQWLLSNRADQTLSWEDTQQLNHYHNKENLDYDEHKVYAYLLDRSKETLLNNIPGHDQAASDYLTQAVNHMIKEKAAGQALERPIEENFNRSPARATRPAPKQQEDDQQNAWQKVKGIFQPQRLNHRMEVNHLSPSTASLTSSIGPGHRRGLPLNQQPHHPRKNTPKPPNNHAPIIPQNTKTQTIISAVFATSSAARHRLGGTETPHARQPRLPARHTHAVSVPKGKSASCPSPQSTSKATRRSGPCHANHPQSTEPAITRPRQTCTTSRRPPTTIQGNRKPPGLPTTRTNGKHTCASKTRTRPP